MMNIAICDDEKSQLNKLHKTLSTLLDLKGLEYTIFEFKCGEDLVKALSINSFDIIFLDIEMRKLDGIATAKNIRLYDNTAVIIFVTAYPDFVFQGYEVKALNYILKPYKSEKIAEVLNIALTELERIQDKYYAIELKSGTYKLNLNNTFYFASNKRKITAVTSNNCVEFYDKLNDLEKKLPPFFIRIHQRYLVNINFVSVVENGYIIINDDKLPVSRNHQNQLIISFAKTILS